MASVLMLVGAIVVGVLVTTFLRKRGSGRGKRIAAGFVAGIVALVVLAMAFGPPAPAPSAVADTQPAASAEAPAASAPAKADRGPEVYKTTARDLYRDYDANEVAADKRMKGKVVEVTGTLDSIDKDFMDHVVLQMRTGAEFMTASMTMRSSEADKAAELSKGAQVTVRCKKMMRVMGSPAGDDCVLVD